MISQISRIKGALFGLAAGDALGVPVEFTSRHSLIAKPVVGMRGFGTHNQPPGTWSDDASLTFCLAESITRGFSLTDLANRFVNWLNSGYWTPHGNVFDVGIATGQAIGHLKNGSLPTQAGLTDEYSNGNGSLMRILPVIFYHQNWPLNDRVQLVRDISSLTHRHVRSLIACVLYVEYARLLLEGIEKTVAYEQLCSEAPDWLATLQPPSHELHLFDRITKGTIPELCERDVKGSGYVLHALEASLWCFLTTTTYKEAVLKAVNLGEDTDTTGAITGGLGGLYYGFESIPSEWVKSLSRHRDIHDLSERFLGRIAAIQK